MDILRMHIKHTYIHTHICLYAGKKEHRDILEWLEKPSSDTASTSTPKGVHK